MMLERQREIQRNIRSCNSKGWIQDKIASDKYKIVTSVRQGQRYEY